MKPVPGDYAPYYEPYIALLPNKEIVAILQDHVKTVAAFLAEIPVEKEEYRYAEDKWTIKEIVGHIIDTERVMSYRALAFARGDKNELPGFNQDDYIMSGNFNDRTMYSLIEEYQAVRASTIFLAQGLRTEDMGKRGIANNKNVTVAALLHIIAGHELHHIKVIEEKYLD